MTVTCLEQTPQLLVYLAENYLEHIRILINSATHSISKSVCFRCVSKINN